MAERKIRKSKRVGETVRVNTREKQIYLNRSHSQAKTSQAKQRKVATCLTLTDEGIIDTTEIGMPVKMEPSPDNALHVGSHQAYSHSPMPLPLPLSSQNAHGDNSGHSHRHSHGQQASVPAGDWNWNRPGAGGAGSVAGSARSGSVATTPITTPIATTSHTTHIAHHPRGLPPQAAAAAAPNVARNAGESRIYLPGLDGS